MLIELKPVMHEFNNCFQGQVETIVEQCYRRNYLYTQLVRWENHLNVSDNQIVNYMPRGFFTADELQQIGLKIEEVVCSTIEDTMSRIIEEIVKGIPVIVGIQIANCPWDPNYQKEFVMEHIITIHGYDEEKKVFLCCDSIYDKSAEELPLEEFRAGGSLQYRKIIATKQEGEYQLATIEELIFNQAKKMLEREENDFFRLRNIGDFYNRNASCLEIKEEHLDNVLFSNEYMEIRDFAKARELMCYILKNHEKGAYLTELFQSSMKNWIYLRILYVRACTTEKKEKCFKRIAQIFHFIADLEEAIARYIVSGELKEIESYLPKKQEVKENKDSENMKKSNVKNISLAKYYNNKAFGTMSENETASFSVSGEYMLYPDKKVEIALEEGINVELSLASGFDNVICSGQNIEVKLEHVSKLYIIGTTEYIGEDSNIIVHYEKNNQQKIPLDFPEWYTEIMQQEVLVGKFSAIQKEEKEVKKTSFAGKIFMKQYNLQENFVNQIDLPPDGRIHIFYMFAL